MKIFLDANVLVSVLNNEYPLFTYSSRVLSLIDNKKFKVYTSPLCLAIAFYFAEKKNGNELARKRLHVLAQKINITNTDASTVIDTVGNKAIHDIEDGIEYYSALNANCKCIITEDIEDFYFSKIEVKTSQQFLEDYLC